MLRNLRIGASLAVALAIAPVGISTYGLSVKNASAVPTFRPGSLKPGKTRTFGSGGEFRVCNEGPVAVRMWVDNSISGASVDAPLQPGRCAQAIGTMMRFTNESNVPVDLYAFGGLGGRAPSAPHAH